MYNCVFCVVFLENELNLKYSDYHIYQTTTRGNVYVTAALIFL